MSEETTFDNDMRGTLWTEKERKSEKSPTATGTITVSGVALRIAMWPKRKAGGNGKRAGEDYWPISVEYKQGTKFVLAKVSPANIVVTGAVGSAESSGAAEQTAPAENGGVDDMPF